MERIVEAMAESYGENGTRDGGANAGDLWNLS